MAAGGNPEFDAYLSRTLPPQLLEQYEAAVPGAGTRLLALITEEAVFRRQMQERELTAEIELMRRESTEARLGQIFAFVITLAFAGLGAYIITNGHPIAGTIFGGVGLGSIVSTFIWGRSRQSPVDEGVMSVNTGADVTPDTSPLK
jgi:uncharacterized membrane protein